MGVGRGKKIDREFPDFLFGDEEQRADSRAWFVYLFALADCSAFKVGFSCSPLQRICTFSRRYFERFDLSQSVLLKLPQCELARAMESALKTELASYRTDAPSWVPMEAGGHTEWFSAVYFAEAEARLHASVATHDTGLIPGLVANAFEFFRVELERVSTSFEPWARSQAKRNCDAWSSAQRGYMVRDHSASLRDWFDAYRYFDVPLFADDPATLEFVRTSARLSIGSNSYR
jgi:hypothetical protein